MLCLLILFLFSHLQPFLHMLPVILFPVVTVLLAVLLAHLDPDQYVRLGQQKCGLNSCLICQPMKIASVAAFTSHKSQQRPVHLHPTDPFCSLWGEGDFSQLNLLAPFYWISSYSSCFPYQSNQGGTSSPLVVDQSHAPSQPSPVSKDARSSPQAIYYRTLPPRESCNSII